LLVHEKLEFQKEDSNHHDILESHRKSNDAILKVKFENDIEEKDYQCEIESQQSLVEPGQSERQLISERNDEKQVTEENNIPFLVMKEGFENISENELNNICSENFDRIIKEKKL
jgi:hypothetical protein